MSKLDGSPECRPDKSRFNRSSALNGGPVLVIHFVA